MFKSFRGQNSFQAAGVAPAFPHGPESWPTNGTSLLDLEFAQISDTGPTRPHNEDCLGYVVPDTEEMARTHGWLFVVADGVGGHAQGEVALHAAVESLLAGFRGAAKGEALPTLLQRLVQG